MTAFFNDGRYACLRDGGRDRAGGAEKRREADPVSRPCGTASAKTLNFLTEKGITDYEELAARAEKSADRFDAVSGQIRELEERISQNRALQGHIIDYAKTVDVYRAYRKAKNKAAYRAAHAEELEKYEAAKRAFDAWPESPYRRLRSFRRSLPPLLIRRKSATASIGRRKRENGEDITVRFPSFWGTGLGKSNSRH